MKACARCKEKNDSKAHAWCKACCRGYARAYRQTPKQKEYNRAYRRTDKCKSYRASSRGKLLMKKANLKHRYGVSLDLYNELFVAQNGCCAVCARAASDLSQGLNLDHCHKTDAVRGLLCDNCNKALGLFRDDGNVLLAARVYLETPTMSKLNFRKTALSKQGDFKPAKAGCVVVKPGGK